MGIMRDDTATLISTAFTKLAMIEHDLRLLNGGDVTKGTAGGRTFAEQIADLRAAINKVLAADALAAAPPPAHRPLPRWSR